MRTSTTQPVLYLATNTPMLGFEAPKRYNLKILTTSQSLKFGNSASDFSICVLTSSGHCCTFTVDQFLNLAVFLTGSSSWTRPDLVPNICEFEPGREGNEMAKKTVNIILLG